MTQSGIKGNEGYINDWTKDELAAQIAGNSNHTKSMADFQKWWRTIQSRRGWHVGKGYKIESQSGGGWKVTFTASGDVMNTSA
jgi:hypothetical protein